MVRWCLRVAALVALPFVAAADARAATILAGTPISLSPTEFALPVEVADASGLIAWEFDLVYDPADVQVDTDCDPFVDDYCDLLTGFATEGDFFSAGDPFNVLNPGFVDLDLALQQTGLLFAVQGAYGGPLPAPSGDGVLAYIRFVTIGTGESPITVQNASVTEDVPVPEPATVLLVTIGLPWLGVRSAWHRRQRTSRERRPRHP